MVKNQGQGNQLYAVTAYGTTLRHKFPLILIFGREYNNQGKILKSVGDYPLTTKSQFWNRSYTFISRQTGKNFKSIAHKQNSSPIIFSNALPLPIPFGSSASTIFKLRKSQNPKNVERHIKNVFSLPILKRVQLVILSGLNHKESFGHATAEISKSCKAVGIRHMEIPYFAAPQNTNAIIDLSVKKVHHKAINQIIGSFLSDQAIG